MMKKYGSYKPSGIDWIGDIPEHWELKKQKYVAKLYTGDSLNDKEKEEYSSISDGTAIPYIASKDIDRDTEFIDYENGMMIPLSNEKEFVKAPKNSFLLCIEGGSAGKKMGYLDRTVCFVNKLCCFDSKLNKYHYYYIKSKSFSDSFVRCLQGMIGGVSVTELSNLKIPVPPCSEQIAIANYLDAKCAKIDNVVAIQQKRIELLKELKQSIITKAVTKGLDKNTKMKDSGIEWIGEVPEGWEIKKIKHLFKIYAGATPKTENDTFWDGDIVWITPADYKTTDKFVIQGERNITKEGYDSCNTQLVPKGSIIFSKRAPIGTVALNGVELCTNQGCLSCVPQKVNSLYYYYVMSICTELFDMLGSGATFKEISADVFANVKLPTPPPTEQISIAAYLDTKCATIDKQIQKVEKQIELLKEYKQSVITECVTGKRKVC